MTCYTNDIKVRERAVKNTAAIGVFVEKAGMTSI